MNGLILLAWIVGLGFLAACYIVAVAISEAPVREADLSRLDVLDGVGQHEQWRNDRAKRLGIDMAGDE